MCFRSGFCVLRRCVVRLGHCASERRRPRSGFCAPCGADLLFFSTRPGAKSLAKSVRAVRDGARRHTHTGLRTGATCHDGREAGWPRERKKYSTSPLGSSVFVPSRAKEPRENAPAKKISHVNENLNITRIYCLELLETNVRENVTGCHRGPTRSQSASLAVAHTPVSAIRTWRRSEDSCSAWDSLNSCACMP